MLGSQGNAKPQEMIRNRIRRGKRMKDVIDGEIGA